MKFKDIEPGMDFTFEGGKYGKLTETVEVDSPHNPTQRNAVRLSSYRPCFFFPDDKVEISK